MAALSGELAGERQRSSALAAQLATAPMPQALAELTASVEQERARSTALAAQLAVEKAAAAGALEAAESALAAERARSTVVIEQLQAALAAAPQPSAMAALSAALAEARMEVDRLAGLIRLGDAERAEAAAASVSNPNSPLELMSTPQQSFGRRTDTDTPNSLAEVLAIERSEAAAARERATEAAATAAALQARVMELEQSLAATRAAETSGLVPPVAAQVPVSPHGTPSKDLSALVWGGWAETDEGKPE